MLYIVNIFILMLYMLKNEKKNVLYVNIYNNLYILFNLMFIYNVIYKP